MAAPAQPQGIGASVQRKEDRRFLLGKGTYTDDVTLPDQSYAVFVRSMYAHAKVNKVALLIAISLPLLANGGEARLDPST